MVACVFLYGTCPLFVTNINYLGFQAVKNGPIELLDNSGTNINVSGSTVQSMFLSVRACNGFGCSTNENTTIASTFYAHPPRSVKVRLGDTALKLNVEIEPFLDNGGANITHYETSITYDQCEPVANDSIIGDWDFATRASKVKVGEKIVANEGTYDSDGLVLSNKYAMTSGFSVALAARTMTSCFTLNSLNSKSGAVFAVDRTSGHQFDAIVWGEIHEQYWMLGSDNFVRTTQFGAAETLKDIETSRETCMTITQSASGRMCGYRNGILYGACCKLYILHLCRFGDGVCPGVPPLHFTNIFSLFP